MATHLFPYIFFIALLIITDITIDAQDSIIWDDPIEVAPKSSGYNRPRIVYDGQGKPLLIWGRSKNVVFSRWDGMKFTKPVQLNPDLMGIASANWMGPNIATKGDTVYVVYKQVPEADTNSHIWCLKSIDGGKSFSDHVRVDYLVGEFSRFPTVTIDDLGNPIVGFMKFNKHFEESRWVISKSVDFGLTFAKDVQASNLKGPSTEACDCCPGTVVANNKDVVIIYRNNQGDLRDIWINISNDSGETFNEGLNIDQQDWELFSCPASGPDAIIIQDTLYATFMNGASGMGRVFLNKISLQNPEASEGQLLIREIDGLRDQNFPRTASYKKSIAIVWEQNVKGVKELPIMYSQDISISPLKDYGTFASNRVINADVAVTDIEIFVVWQDLKSRSVKFRRGTFANITNNSNLRTNNLNFKVVSNPSISNWLITGDYLGDDMEYRLMSENGQVINSGLIPVNGGNDFFKIDGVALQAGCYYLHIYKNNGYQVIKLIKL